MRENIFRALLITTRAIVCMAAILLLGAASLAADEKKKFDFEFTNVADSTQGFTNFQTFPAINNKGHVVFVADRSGVGQGVFRSRDGDLETIASVKDGFQFFGGEPAINAKGVVAFTALTSSGSVAILTGNGQSRTLIVDSTANGLFRQGIGSPALNDAGIVAFQALRNEPGFPTSIFTWTRGTLEKVLSTSSAGFGAFANVDINNGGKISFRGFLQDGTEGIFIGTSNPAAVVTTKSNPELGRGFSQAVINNAGTIGVLGFLTAGGVEVITGDSRRITVQNDPAMPAINNFTEHPSINNHGDVAFFVLAFPDAAAPAGIFLSGSGQKSLIPVIRPGDKLFGSTVSSVDLGRFGLNDRFEMAFQYVLEDGRSGIAIASLEGAHEDDEQE